MMPPPQEVLVAYGFSEPPRLMDGGRVSGAWQVGGAVLKRAGDAGEEEWRRRVYLAWPGGSGVRVPRPLPDRTGRWVVDGWTAHVLVPGQTVSVVEDPDWFRKACDGFLDVTSGLARPAFLDTRDDPWTAADRLLDTDAEQPVAVAGFVRECRRGAQSIDEPAQVVHADLTGNVLRDGESAGVIDWPAQWWPRELALAIVVADALCWQGATVALLDAWGDVGGPALRRALAWRALTKALLGPAPDLSRERAALALVELYR